MSSTYSPDLRIELIGTGDQAGVWGATTNTNLGTLLESAIAGYTSVSISSSSQALTVYDGAEDQARFAAIALTTVTSANFNVYIPPSSKLYVLYNASSYTATIYCSTVAGNTTAAGTGIAIPTGKKMALWTDGTNVYQQNDYLISPTLITPALSAETYSTSATVTAGTNAQGQGTMTSDINIVTTTAANPSGVTLPTATTGRIVTVVNKGTNAINVYPDTSAYIDALSINTSIQIPVNSSLQFIAASTTRWYSSATGDTGSGANVRAVAPQLDAETYTTSATVSAAGTVQGDATALTSDYNITTTVASGSGVVMPTATTGRRMIVVNKGANALKIYPASGAAIDALGTNTALSLPVAGWLELDAASTTQWYSSYNSVTATTATNATNLVTTNFSISESGGVLAFIAHPSFTASISSTTMTVTVASVGYVVYGATLTGTGVTGGTTVATQLTSTETAAASPTYSSGGAIGDTNFVVSSTSGISIGQMIDGLGVPTGTYVGSITVDNGTNYINLVDRTGAAVAFTIQAAGTYNFRAATAKGTYTVSASQTVSSTTITGTKTVAQITNTGVITSQP